MLIGVLGSGPIIFLRSRFDANQTTSTAVPMGKEAAVATVTVTNRR